MSSKMMGNKSLNQRKVNALLEFTYLARHGELCVNEIMKSHFSMSADATFTMY